MWRCDSRRLSLDIALELEADDAGSADEEKEGGNNHRTGSKDDHMVIVGDALLVDKLGADWHGDQVPERDDEVGGGVSGAELSGHGDLSDQDGCQGVCCAEGEAVNAGKHVVSDDVVVGEPDGEKRDDHHRGNHDHDVEAADEVAHESRNDLA
ncbi:hypothetical protein PMKS-002766 [Pichia membranifaciens]|uniref:Uncharacterized protein n=1 Tax=Pichia membranifaciens TaxID=4926 RepID=A0A1Q2YIB3_9ASCO|nr:hypothetical protein PMKS-002766 [Pichia membranifaciens]